MRLIGVNLPARLEKNVVLAHPPAHDSQGRLGSLQGRCVKGPDQLAILTAIICSLFCFVLLHVDVSVHPIHDERSSVLEQYVSRLYSAR
ncbi:hypothetical protein M430DRAFT_68432 [Amorphotheca resinae ATCC 22711]|jgi:hypothetical protein|uniref:Uncharacterized protein n=1 Tax=Amorphotheca resinae ATCC 22711 TaxID=857342 RepID=A0A2T3AXH2_AMORE|nr:hypothetical protein M430DRAFT_68432 [Amorphotheca resinae ATCC 22711]PSS13330.1 hypothetical protein M430DRAFT_68432 [Amorphotheca resinae ATCC 22711]